MNHEAPTQHEKPTGVRLTGPNLDIEMDDLLTYTGIDQQGCHAWEFPVSPAWYDMLQAGRLHVRIGVLPETTVVAAVPAHLPERPR